MFSTHFKRIATVLALLAPFGAANAQFEARDINGDGTADAYYDIQHNLSWLADANLWATLGNPAGTDASGQPMQLGQMSFVAAATWVADLSVHGVGDWRLPERFIPAGGDSSYCNATSCSAWDPAAQSELSFLATALGGAEGPFQNVQNGAYMTSFSYDSGTGGGLAVLELNNVLDNTRFLTNQTDLAFGYVWAVRGGDVAQVTTPVPEPSTYALMLVGLAGFGWFAAKRRKEAPCQAMRLGAVAG